MSYAWPCRRARIRARDFHFRGYPFCVYSGCCRIQYRGGLAGWWWWQWWQFRMSAQSQRLQMSWRGYLWSYSWPYPRARTRAQDFHFRGYPFCVYWGCRQAGGLAACWGALGGCQDEVEVCLKCLKCLHRHLRAVVIDESPLHFGDATRHRRKRGKHLTPGILAATVNAPVLLLHYAHRQ